MHQLSPAVERVLAASRVWAGRCGSEAVRLTHLLLALFDEEEGRPAALLESVGLSLDSVREDLKRIGDSPVAPDDAVLFRAARDWSLRHRHDPELLTDAFLLVVLRADSGFERAAATIGLDAVKLEANLLRNRESVSGDDSGHGFQEGTFQVPDASSEMEAARVLDANLNRAREAARVLDDYCRFVLNDRVLTTELKEIRHQLAALAARLPSRLLLAARDTPGDVGTSITASGEYERSSPPQIATANLKRLQESLRSLEEFGKLADPGVGREFEALRYRVYSIENPLLRRESVRGKLAASKLYVLLTGSDCQAALDWTIERAAAGGATIVQLREKTLADRELLARARDVRRWTHQAGVLFVMNDRPDIARLAEADGVHLGQGDLQVAEARRVVGPHALIGVSTHDIDQVRQAVLDGADYLGVGPVFSSKTKTFANFPGLEFVRAATAETSLPAFALGGITCQNVAQVIAAGSKRIAVSSAVVRAEDPENTTRELRAALERSEQPAE
jgi:thiamine-phosphate pyrophosphorylase